MFAFFYSSQNVLTEKTIIGLQLSCIGKCTLAIYFIHFFFLPLIRRSDLIVCDEDWYIRLVYALLALFIAIVIVYACIAIKYIIGYCKPLHQILLGR